MLQQMLINGTLLRSIAYTVIPRNKDLKGGNAGIIQNSPRETPVKLVDISFENAIWRF
jgi:hypothetical protein